MVLERTIQQRRERVNVDSLLSFDGVNQYASAGVNPNIAPAIDFDKTFSISLMAELVGQNRQFSVSHRSAHINSNSTNIGGWGIEAEYNISTQKYRLLFLGIQNNTGDFYRYATPYLINGGLHHIVLSKVGAGPDFIFFVDRHPYAALAQPDTGIVETYHRGDEHLTFGARYSQHNNAISEPLAGKINHIAMLDSPLTEPEIHYIHRYGGLIPESTHLTCVAHYKTLTSGKIITDLVEDYNPAKVAAGVTTLTAYPADLINFTDAQVGIPNQSSNTAYLDFYDKTPIIS